MSARWRGEADGALDASPRGQLAGLRRRIVLTWRYRGPLSLAYRALTFPLRATPLRGLLGLEGVGDQSLRAARRWYRRNRRPVLIVLTGGAQPPSRIRRRRVRTADATSARLPSEDLVLLDGRLAMSRGWLAALQYEACAVGAGGLAGPLVLDARGAIASAGLCRAAQDGVLEARFVGRARDYGPATVALPVSALDRGCVYLTRELIEALGHAPAPSELVAYCADAWENGYEVRYAASATATRADPATPDVGAAAPPVRRRLGTLDGHPQVVYVTENTIVGGGHRDVFEHLNRLATRGHDVSLFTLSGPPDWFDLRVPVRSFAGYGPLVEALEPLAAIKVATWWNTAAPVWLASVNNGIPVYFVQDIETSYYPDDHVKRFEVLASYREEFSYMTISGWNRDRLSELGLASVLVAPGVDVDVFHPRAGVVRRGDVVLALGRTNPLKNFPLTLSAWRELAAPRPQLRLFGIEPELASEPGIAYETAPSDERVAELLCEAGVFVQTSTHEGFCLPVLEAMACGTPVVCTDADGNRDFCVDGENCLMPAGDARSVAGAIARVLSDPGLAARLSAAGIATAADYAWERRIDRLEEVLRERAADVATG